MATSFQMKRDIETVLESKSIDPYLFRMQLNGMYPELDQLDEERIRDSPCLPSEKEQARFPILSSHIGETVSHVDVLIVCFYFWKTFHVGSLSSGATVTFATYTANTFFYIYLYMLCKLPFRFCP